MRKWMVAVVMAAALGASQRAHANLGATAPAANTTVGGTSGLLLQTQLSGATRTPKKKGTPSWLTRGATADESPTPTGSGRLRRMAARGGAGGR